MNDFPKRILLYTDGSEDAALAAPVVVSLANKAGSELHVVHVWHTAAPFSPPTWFKDDAQRRLDEEVVNLSDEIDADLIVVGVVMGLGPAEQKILEGLSDDIVHHARCPVLVMRPDDREQLRSAETAPQ